MDKQLSESQLATIKCAFLDLVGSYNAYTNNDMYYHSWDAHRETLSEMMDAFPFLKEMDAVIEEDLDKCVFEE
jgi:hypothetical protein